MIVIMGWQLKTKSTLTTHSYLYNIAEVTPSLSNVLFWPNIDWAMMFHQQVMFLHKSKNIDQINSVRLAVLRKLSMCMFCYYEYILYPAPLKDTGTLNKDLNICSECWVISTMGRKTVFSRRHETTVAVSRIFHGRAAQTRISRP